MSKRQSLLQYPFPGARVRGQHSPLSPLMRPDFCPSIMDLLSWNYCDLFLSLLTNLFKIFCHHLFSIWFSLDSYHHWWHFQHSSWFFRCKTKYKKNHFVTCIYFMREEYELMDKLWQPKILPWETIHLFSKKGLNDIWNIITCILS